MSQFEDLKEQHKKGQFAPAIEGYIDILQNEPNNHEVHYELSDAYFRSQNNDDALKHIERCIKLEPYSDKYLQLQGRIFFSLNRLGEASAAFEKSISQNPNLFYSYVALGDIHVMQNKLEKAREHYHLALKVHEDGVPAIVKLAKLDMLKGQAQQALKKLQEIEQQYPDELELKLHIGMAKLELGESGFAEIYFKKILDEIPNQVLAKAYLAISLIQHEPEQSTQIIRELIQVFPNAPEVRVALGLFQHYHGNNAAAIKQLYPFCQSELAFPSWILALARSLALGNQTDEAIQTLERLLQRGNIGPALLLLGRIQQNKKNFDLAIQAYLKIDDNDPELNTARVHIAECLYQQKKYPQCIQIADQILKQMGHHPDAVKIKINALAQLNKPKEAVAIIEQLKPANSDKGFTDLMHLYAGLLLDSQEDYKKAWGHFSEIKHDSIDSLLPLSREDENSIKKWGNKAVEDDLPTPIFVFSDPATGHHDFIQWLIKYNETLPLLDRLGKNPRKDFLTQGWSINDLAKLNETQIHLLRRKYHKFLNPIRDKANHTMVDFLPFNIVSATIIKRIYPDAKIIVLSRNSADIRLHHRIFGAGLVAYDAFKSILNQMIAIDLNLSVVDIDQLKTKNSPIKAELEKLIGKQLTEFQNESDSVLDVYTLPYMHWKNYQEYMD